MNVGTVYEVDELLIALVRVRVIGTNGLHSDVDAILDTGFTGALTLPAAQIDALGLAFREFGPMTLADGRQQETAVYRGAVEWAGELRDVLIVAADSEPLLGMELLRGHAVTLQAEGNGSVDVAPLSHQ